MERLTSKIRLNDLGVTLLPKETVACLHESLHGLADDGRRSLLKRSYLERIEQLNGLLSSPDAFDPANIHWNRQWGITVAQVFRISDIFEASADYVIDVCDDQFSIDRRGIICLEIKRSRPRT